MTKKNCIAINVHIVISSFFFCSFDHIMPFRFKEDIKQMELKFPIVPAFVNSHTVHTLPLQWRVMASEAGFRSLSVCEIELSRARKILRGWRMCAARGSFNVSHYRERYLPPPLSLSLCSLRPACVRGNNNKCAARAWKRTDIRAVRRHIQYLNARSNTSDKRELRRYRVACNDLGTPFGQRARACLSLSLYV